MNRIDRLFNTLKSENKTALIPFITAGYPTTESTVTLMHTLVDNGADMIEIGVPFSDPVADGPVIQASSFEAIKNGVNIPTILDMVVEFRQHNQHTPLVFMGYANPIEAFGWENYAQAANQAGVDGLLTVDLQPEPEDKWGNMCKNKDIKRVILLAPTTSEKRQDALLQYASGFIYYVALKGVTGSNELKTREQNVSAAVAQLKSKTSVPVVVGFGVKDAESAKSLSNGADGVVVGSKIISLLAEHLDDVSKGIKEVGRFTTQLKEAIN